MPDGTIFYKKILDSKIPFFFSIAFREWEIESEEKSGTDIEFDLMTTNPGHANREVESLLYSGLTTYQIELILLNAIQIDFVVNIFGFHQGNSYPIHIGVGAKSSSKRNIEAKEINIFKVNLHKDDFYDNIDVSTAAELLGKWLDHKNEILNRVETEKIKKRILEGTKTDQEKHRRKIANEVFNFRPKYEIEETKKFK